MGEDEREIFEIKRWPRETLNRIRTMERLLSEMEHHVWWVNKILDRVRKDFALTVLAAFTAGLALGVMLVRAVQWLRP